MDNFFIDLVHDNKFLLNVQCSLSVFHNGHRGGTLYYSIQRWTRRHLRQDIRPNTLNTQKLRIVKICVNLLAVIIYSCCVFSGNSLDSGETFCVSVKS